VVSYPWFNPGTPGRHGNPDPAPPRPKAARHVWVLDGSARWPGLLLEWRRGDARWLGRVAYGVDKGLTSASAELREAWFEAKDITPL
jgi:hypothetical protein